MARRALQIFRAKLGEAHPNTRGAADFLHAIEEALDRGAGVRPSASAGDRGTVDPGTQANAGAGESRDDGGSILATAKERLKALLFGR